VSTLADARAALADAVAGTGLDCTAYPPDSLVPPAAFVDTLAVDYDTGGVSFCETGLATATIVACAQRHDRAGGSQQLEERVRSILDAVTAIDGVRVLGVESGSAEVAGTSLPAVVFTVRFGIRG